MNHCSALPATCTPPPLPASGPRTLLQSTRPLSASPLHIPSRTRSGMMCCIRPPATRLPLSHSFDEQVVRWPRPHPPSQLSTGPPHSSSPPHVSRCVFPSSYLSAPSLPGLQVYHTEHVSLGPGAPSNAVGHFVICVFNHVIGVEGFYQ